MTTKATAQQKPPSRVIAPANTGTPDKTHGPAISHLPGQNTAIEMQRLIGNTAVQRLVQSGQWTPAGPRRSAVIQRTPVTETAALAVARDQVGAAPPALRPGLMDELIRGNFAYKGQYEDDAAGGFKSFVEKDLNDAPAYYYAWSKQVSAPAGEQMSKEMRQLTEINKKNEEKRRQAAAAAKKRKAENAEKAETGLTTRLANEFKRVEANKARINATYAKAIAAAKSDSQKKMLENKRDCELSTQRVMGQYGPKIYQRLEAEQAGKLEEFKAARPERERN